MSHALARNDAAAAEQRAALRADALAGLSAPRKTLPCKWLYDAEGARLFEEITRLPEYYPTRTEIGILTEQAPSIAAAVGPGATVVEFGPGDGGKAVLLLSRLQAPAAYVPVEIAPEWLDAVAARVSEAGARRAGHAGRRRFHPGLRPARRRPAQPTPRLLPRLHHRQFRADGRGRPAPPLPNRARLRRPAAARRRPGEGPRHAGSRL